MTRDNRPKRDRNAEVLRLWTYGWTQKRIAQHYGVTQQCISDIITTERAKLPLPSRDELIQREREFLDHLRGMAMDVAHLTPAPVTAGKDGQVVIDPETGAIVRDYSGRLQAMAAAQSTSRDVRKLCGLDAPTQIVADATVRYEVVGIDEGELQ